VRRGNPLGKNGRLGFVTTIQYQASDIWSAIRERQGWLLFTLNYEMSSRTWCGIQFH